MRLVASAFTERRNECNSRVGKDTGNAEAEISNMIMVLGSSHSWVQGTSNRPRDDIVSYLGYYSTGDSFLFFAQLQGQLLKRDSWLGRFQCGQLAMELSTCNRIHGALPWAYTGLERNLHVPTKLLTGRRS